MTPSVQRTILSGEEASEARVAIETASWIWHPEVPAHQAAVLRFNIGFEAMERPLIFHISADQRFSLKLDGIPIARGPDCGDPAHWPFSSYRLHLQPGPHHLSAEVWWIGDQAPLARMTVEGGFILKAEGEYHEQLTTGTAPWQVALCPEYSFRPWTIEEYQAVGDQLTVDGRLRNTAPEYPARTVKDAAHKPLHGLFEDKWVLAPTPLPDQLSESVSCGVVRAVMNRRAGSEQAIPPEAGNHPELQAIQNLIDNRHPWIIPGGSTISFLCDLQDYFCAFPKINLAGGLDAQVSWSWAESLYEKDLITKTNRNQVNDLYFTGIEDRFISNGKESQAYETLWWRSGRYILISISTAEEPLTLQALELEETRFPLHNDSRFHCEEPELQKLIDICFRGLQCNSHEKAADCPYYEQLMYTGDTRVQALIQFATSTDTGLPRRCIELFNWSRASGCSGLTTARYPDRATQWIPPFSLIWVWMVHDYFYWRNEPDFVKEQLVGVRAVLNAFTAFLNRDHLLEKVPHWTFVDWTEEWVEGYPPDARNGVSSLLNLLYVQTLEKAVKLETTLGNEKQADVYRLQRDLTGTATVNTFWDNDRGLMADDIARLHFSEHGQALTALSTSLDLSIRRRAVQGLSAHASILTRASIYFSFYIFEALLLMDETTDIRRRLEPWFQLPAQGFKTTPEEFGHSRSDCHAWGSHPLYLFHTGILGIRPATPGFRTIVITPRDVGWKQISGTTVHPRGMIETAFRFSEDRLEADITLPEEITGTLLWNGQSVELTEGANHVRVENRVKGEKP